MQHSELLIIPDQFVRDYS